MSITYTKLFSSITESSVWFEPNHVRLVWITMLAMADRKGRVYASVPGLAHRARVSIEEAQEALDRFFSPDQHSRTKEFEGRRIEEIDGGWRLLNYVKFRSLRDEESYKEAKRKYINERRAKEKNVENISTVEHASTESNQAEAEAEAEAEAVNNKSSSAVASPAFIDDSKIEFLQKNDAYKELDVREQFLKMEVWCRANGRQPTYRRFVNWLNRCDKPMHVTPQSVKPNGSISPAQATYQHQEELKRVEASIASVKNNASADALGPIYSADEKKKLSELRARRSQLCDLLGFPK